VVYRKTRVTWAALPYQNRVEYLLQYLILQRLILWRLIFFSIEDYSNSDTSSESEYKSDQESIPGSDSDTDELPENLEPELSEIIHDEYENTPWNPEAQLHADIKARVQL
jgi:hypothetical protein